jgi:hypothetical protein
VDESEYIDVVVDTDMFVEQKPPKVASVLQSLLVGQKHASAGENKSQVDMERWKPFFSGFPKDTLFGASDLTSERWSRTSLGDFFQTSHLFSDLGDACHLVSLSFITRRVLRFIRRPESKHPSSTATLLRNLLGSSDPDKELTLLHNTLVEFYANLPARFMYWESLEFLMGERDPGYHCTIPEATRLSAISVMINLLFFYTISLLHQVF